MKNKLEEEVQIIVQNIIVCSRSSEMHNSFQIYEVKKYNDLLHS